MSLRGPWVGADQTSAGPLRHGRDPRPLLRESIQRSILGGQPGMPILKGRSRPGLVAGRLSVGAAADNAGLLGPVDLCPEFPGPVTHHCHGTLEG
ncbi:MAG: hypothetical protein ACK550_15790 [Synechococcaceae cyanobacterium]